MVRSLKKILLGAEMRAKKYFNLRVQSAVNYLEIAMQGQKYGTTNNETNAEERQHFE
jgi:hypothetical protein